MHMHMPLLPNNPCRDAFQILVFGLFITAIHFYLRQLMGLGRIQRVPFIADAHRHNIHRRNKFGVALVSLTLRHTDHL